MDTPRLTLVTLGAFASRVGDRLAARYPGSETVDASAPTHLSAWPALDAIVVVADYDNVELCELAERASFAWRRPWFPVVLEQAQLRCGPVVVPGVTACHVCFRRRRRQHARNPGAWRDTPGAAVAGDRVRGWARHHVDIAYGLAVQAVADAFDPEPRFPGAWVRVVGIADTTVNRSGVIAADACARCRDASEREGRQGRLVAALRSALS